MRALFVDRLLLGAALAAAMGSCGWYGWRGRLHGRMRRDARIESKQCAAYESADRGVPATPPGKWLPPGAQARGREWVYDVFTPPDIFYNADTQQFVVSRPGAAAAKDAPGLELVAVRRTPFRLQLVGYVGGADRYLGAFENELSGEVFLAGAGRSVPALGLVITEFAVEWRAVPLADRRPSNLRIATAMVRDERTGDSTKLTSGERCYTDELSALLTADGDEDDTPRELRPGDEVQSADQSYILERLQLNPPLAELTQVAPGMAPPPVRLSLTPQQSLESLSTKPASRLSP